MNAVQVPPLSQPPTSYRNIGPTASKSELVDLIKQFCCKSFTTTLVANLRKK